MQIIGTLKVLKTEKMFEAFVSKIEDQSD